MSILITGVSGQVGGALLRLLGEREPETVVHAPMRGAMDLQDAASIRRYVEDARPQWIVSSGAYTAVDAAETDRETAFAVNATAPSVLAEEALRIGAGLIHLSTDYVFPGTGEKPWEETDATAPLNVYGASKLAGEQAIAATGVPHAILRTSWVYSSGGKNFVRTMLRLLSTKDTPLRIVADQHGAPTSADDLAEAVLSIVRRCGDSVSEALAEKSGIYHCAGAGETTWAGLAGAVREYLLANSTITPPEIIPVPGSEYPTPAARPRNSRLDCGKLERAFGIALPDWKASVARAVHRLAATDLPQGCFKGESGSR